MGGKSKAPSADPRIGEAAMLSAKTGQDYLSFMRDQAKVTNQWADEDRDRYKGTFEPLEDQYIRDAEAHDSQGRMGQRVSTARVDARLMGQQAQDAAQRQQAAMGVNPNAGRSLALGQTARMQTGLMALGAGNQARREVRAEAENMRANAINLGKGMAVNPGTSMGLSNGAMSSGFSGAMQGYGQQGSLLNTQYQQQMQSYNARQDQAAGLFGAAGTVIGMLSDKDAKTEKKKPGRSLLKAVENMPVEEWRYKKGQGDEGRHVGTYAQDFQRETGKGDGRSIPIVDAIGTTMGAIKELSAKVDMLAKGRRLAA